MPEGMTAQELLDFCMQQEETYRFKDLSREDVWRLGNIIARRCRETGRPVACEIRVNGLVLFCYYPEGTTEYYHFVLTRKHNTANMMEKSSLRWFAELQVRGLDPERDMKLDLTKLIPGGGAFPIRLQGGCVIGSIAVSGMAHTEDHDLIIESLKEFFGA